MNNETKSYSQIVSVVSHCSNNFDKRLERYFDDEFVAQSSPVLPIIKNFLFNKGKRIRSNLIFLLSKAMNKDVDNFGYNLALAQEFLHNATIIHDDIIDCSELRRGKHTLNYEYDSKLAVLAGDYLLCQAMKIIDECNDCEIRKLHSLSLRAMIDGELKQYFNRFNLLSVEDYVEKSKAKTARLFECGLVSLCLHNGEEKNINDIREFALNFGIAFQINNDLKNFKDVDKTNEDIKNGDYCAPVIFYANENNIDTLAIENYNELIVSIEKSNAIEKSKELLKQFSNRAIENIAFLEDNLYKQALIDLCRLLVEEQNG